MIIKTTIELLCKIKYLISKKNKETFISCRVAEVILLQLSPFKTILGEQ